MLRSQPMKNRQVVSDWLLCQQQLLFCLPFNIVGHGIIGKVYLREWINASDLPKTSWWKWPKFCCENLSNRSQKVNIFFSKKMWNLLMLTTKTFKVLWNLILRKRAKLALINSALIYSLKVCCLCYDKGPLLMSLVMSCSNCT